jgi:pimeloyl-ACP methyl ester carboxylesterase
VATSRRDAIRGVLGAVGLASAMGTLADTRNERRTGLPTPAIDAPGFKRRTVRTNSIDIHYAVAGHGPAVLLLHGWPFTWYTWHRIIPTLARSFTVIAPDSRGIGGSSKPRSGYDTVTLADDAAALLAHEGVGNAAVVGHDLGAGVAYHLAARHPSLVRKLVVMESIILGGPDAHLFMDNPPWWVAFHNVPDLPESLLDGKEGPYLDWFYTNLSHQRSGISRQSRDAHVSGYRGRLALRGGFEQYRAFPQTTEQGRQAAARRLTMPVMALGGELVKDVLYRQMTSLAENATGGVIERCGHIIQEERPDEVLARLRAFL